MNTENRHNYYEILELNENATQQEIHMAYSKAKMTYSAENKALHSIFSAEEASELRTLVEEAYEVLSNNTYRNIYEKRMLANTFTEDDLSIEAIKTASANLFERATPPVFIESTPAENMPAKDLDFENEMANKKDWSGADLKKVREYRDLSFDELTDITKINPWYIAALEEMDPANLPVEVFVRGYVMQISKALGLKDKIVADSYMRLFRKKIEN
ncbi:MAG: helix-turn-helix domain-containing protein [Pseudobdellovibrio sp.]